MLSFIVCVVQYSCKKPYTLNSYPYKLHLEGAFYPLHHMLLYSVTLSVKKRNAATQSSWKNEINKRQSGILVEKIM